MSKNKRKIKSSAVDLNKDYKKLLIYRDGLQDEVKKLKNYLNNHVEETMDIPTDLLLKPDTKPLIQINTKSLENLLNCLSNAETLNQLKFSNEEIEYLPIVEDETDILYRKLYKANCTIRKGTKFQLELTVTENMKKIEAIQSINLKFENLTEGSEISSGLSILRKAKNLHFLLTAIRQYSILSKQREDVLNSLPAKFFEVEVNEDGKQIINCLSKTQKYFSCEWSILWTSHLYNFMHGFEITITYDDDKFCEDVQPIFSRLCEVVESIEDARAKVLQWRNEIVKLIKEYVADLDS